MSTKTRVTIEDLYKVEGKDGILLDMTGTYRFQAAKLYNLNADSVIMGHSDICKNPVAYAMLHAVATT